MSEEAEVMLQASVKDEAFKKAVVGAGYQFLGSK
jgi:hypothetical protein